jgi:hypothetical protein
MTSSTFVVANATIPGPTVVKSEIISLWGWKPFEKGGVISHGGWAPGLHHASRSQRLLEFLSRRRLTYALSLNDISNKFDIGHLSILRLRSVALFSGPFLFTFRFHIREEDHERIPPRTLTRSSCARFPHSFFRRDPEQPQLFSVTRIDASVSAMIASYWVNQPGKTAATASNLIKS